MLIKRAATLRAREDWKEEIYCPSPPPPPLLIDGPPCALLARVRDAVRGGGVTIRSLVRPFVPGIAKISLRGGRFFVPGKGPPLSCSESQVGGKMSL